MAIPTVSGDIVHFLHLSDLLQALGHPHSHCELLFCTPGLMRAGDELEVCSNSRSQDHLSASLHLISGKNSILFAAEIGPGDTSDPC